MDDGGEEIHQGGRSVPSGQLNHFQEQTPAALQLNHFHNQDADPHTTTESNGNLDDQLGLTFEQEQTADELLADIQNAVDEMLQDFQTSPITSNPPPVALKTKKPSKRPQPASSAWLTEYIIHMRSRNGGFGFQILGGLGSDPAQVDYIVPGTYSI